MTPPRARAPQDRLPKASLKESVQGPPDIIEIEATPEPDRVPIFRLDGKLYTIPGRVSAGLTLQVMEEMGTLGDQAAMVRAVRELMGEEAFSALKESRFVTQEHLGAVLDRVMDMVTGAVEAASGK